MYQPSHKCQSSWFSANVKTNEFGCSFSSDFLDRTSLDELHQTQQHAVKTCPNKSSLIHRPINSLYICFHLLPIPKEQAKSSFRAILSDTLLTNWTWCKRRDEETTASLHPIDECGVTMVLNDQNKTFFEDGFYSNANDPTVSIKVAKSSHLEATRHNYDDIQRIPLYVVFPIFLADGETKYKDKDNNQLILVLSIVGTWIGIYCN